MRKGLLGSAFALFASTSFALGQSELPPVTTLPTLSNRTAAKLGEPQEKLPPPKAILEKAEPIGAPRLVEESGVFAPNSGRPLRFWATAEYLLWWTKGSSLPPLVTTGPPLPINPSPGSFAAPGTSVLFGGNQGNENPFSGGRFTLGFWCNDCQTIGAEASFFFLGRRPNNFDANTSGAPGSSLLARPFFDTSTGLFNSELIGYPGLAAGQFSVNSFSSLLGADSNLLFNLCRSCDTSCDPCQRAPARYRVDLLAGVRYLELRDGVRIAENTQVDPTAPFFAGSNINAFDEFNTVNRFYGAQIGIRSEWWRDRMFMNVTAKVALGVTHQTVDINGSTTVTTAAGAVAVLPGNLLTQPSNIGSYSRDRLTFVPELGVNFGYQLTRNLSVFAGYSFIYWSNVQRAGEAISPNVNSTRVPTSVVAPTGPLDPLFNFNGSGYWAQGVNVGIQLRF